LGRIGLGQIGLGTNFSGFEDIKFENFSSNSRCQMKISYRKLAVVHLDTGQFVPSPICPKPIRPNFGQFVPVPICLNIFQNGYTHQKCHVI
jgi:hypothetical protein